ncbi:hypothetical protein [Duganella radicis]|uniref:Uncharacterized protein n=1 Tax=Duganella radicis TaxID=551988 RepID=A0A6L6PPU0_9BURK|nr:hypothetical protein [Duganella radicis]MTV41138.1 hypothetical protein [Duganella radicis]
MTTLIEKMKRVELKVSSKYGAFELFALFQPDTTLRLWDILIAAEWVEQDELASMRIISSYPTSSHRHAIKKLYINVYFLQQEVYNSV